MPSYFILLIFLPFLASCEQQGSNYPPDLLTLLQNEPSISEYATFLTTQHADNLDVLAYTPDQTLLIPSNDAFDKIPYSSLAAAFQENDSDVIRSVMNYHVLQGRHPSASFNGTFQFVPTWLRNTTFQNVNCGQVVGAIQQSAGTNIFTSGLGSRCTVTQADKYYTNGLAHIIDTFLIPPLPLQSTAPSFNLTSFLGALATSPTLNSTLATAADLTFFIPSNAAFAALGQTLEDLSPAALTELLAYHVVNTSSPSSLVGYSSALANGTSVTSMQGTPLTITVASNSQFVNSARVLQSDILLRNGVMHVIDNVLSPNASTAVPNPKVDAQGPVIQGGALPGGEAPFVSSLAGTATSVMSTAVPTAVGPGQALSSTFAVGDIGKGAQTTSSSVLATSAGGTAGGAAASASATVKGGAVGGSVDGRAGSAMGLVGLLLGLC